MPWLCLKKCRWWFFFFCRCVETFLKNAITLPADGALLTANCDVQPLTKPAPMEARASKD